MKLLDMNMEHKAALASSFGLVDADGSSGSRHHFSWKLDVKVKYIFFIELEINLNFLIYNYLLD